MSPEDENGELKKAQFFYDAVVKADEISTRSYERANAKISLLIGVLSTVIPILTGLGYLVLSHTIAVPFFVFYVISLSLLVVALAECVHLLAPKYFYCVDFGKLMVRYDKKPLDFIIFKIAHTWEDVVKDNVKRINSLRSGLWRIVRLIIVGLVALDLSFSLLGIDYYIIGILSTNEPYKSMLSADGWRLTFFVVCVIIFVFLISYTVRYTEDKNDNSALNVPNASGNVKESLASGSKMSEDTNKNEEREFQLEMLRVQQLSDGVSSLMTLIITISVSWIVASFAIIYSTGVASEVKVNFQFGLYYMFLALVIGLIFFYVFEFRILPSRIDQLRERFVNSKKLKHSNGQQRKANWFWNILQWLRKKAKKVN